MPNPPRAIAATSSEKLIRPTRFPYLVIGCYDRIIAHLGGFEQDCNSKQDYLFVMLLQGRTCQAFHT
jgi:hypothetical protein